MLLERVQDGYDVLDIVHTGTCDRQQGRVNRQFLNVLVQQWAKDLPSVPSLPNVMAP